MTPTTHMDFNLRLEAVNTWGGEVMAKACLSSSHLLRLRASFCLSLLSLSMRQFFFPCVERVPCPPDPFQTPGSVQLLSLPQSGSRLSVRLSVSLALTLSSFLSSHLCACYGPRSLHPTRGLRSQSLSRPLYGHEGVRVSSSQPLPSCLFGLNTELCLCPSVQSIFTVHFRSRGIL